MGISKVSALVLFVGGAILLFASDVILPHAAPDLPPSATWIGELIAAGWLAVAALNWLSRHAVLGGIYGRPVVITNLVLYFVTGTVLLRVSFEGPGTVLHWAAALLTLALAAVYGWLLVRGPIERPAPSSGTVE